jgi:hypothetical protein
MSERILDAAELDDAELDAIVGGSQGGDSVRGGYHRSFRDHDRRR